ncbi:MAG: PEP-CTERM sorting domain-containing protein, partial [Pseudomonadota bacterium]
LLDYEFPVAALDTVTLTVTRATEELAFLEGPGALSFFASSSGTYFAQIFAVADTDSGVGLYGFQVINPIPLPASIVMLLSSLGLFGWLRCSRSARSPSSQANL